MALKKRKPVVQLDNFTAYISSVGTYEHNNPITDISVPIKGVGDTLVHDLLYMLHESGGRLYFEESFYLLKEWKIDTETDVLTLKVERESYNDRKY